MKMEYYWGKLSLKKKTKNYISYSRNRSGKKIILHNTNKKTLPTKDIQLKKELTGRQFIWTHSVSQKKNWNDSTQSDQDMVQCVIVTLISPEFSFVPTCACRLLEFLILHLAVALRGSPNSLTQCTRNQSLRPLTVWNSELGIREFGF